MTLQDLILKLSDYWAAQGCLIQQPLDIELGAGTMHPETFLRVLGPQPWNVAYVQPSWRPADGRFGENPNRLFKHHQFQVILKPAPDDVQDLYLQSLEACGIDPHRTDRGRGEQAAAKRAGRYRRRERAAQRFRDERDAGAARDEERGDRRGDAQPACEMDVARVCNRGERDPARHGDRSAHRRGHQPVGDRAIPTPR